MHHYLPEQHAEATRQEPIGQLYILDSEAHSSIERTHHCISIGAQRLCRRNLLCSCTPSLEKCGTHIISRNSMFGCELVKLRFGFRPHLCCKGRGPSLVI